MRTCVHVHVHHCTCVMYIVDEHCEVHFIILQVSTYYEVHTDQSSCWKLFYTHNTSFFFLAVGYAHVVFMFM